MIRKTTRALLNCAQLSYTACIDSTVAGAVSSNASEEDIGTSTSCSISSVAGLVGGSTCTTSLFRLVARRVMDTIPSTFANNVWSLPTPTLVPARNFKPRCRTIIFPAPAGPPMWNEVEQRLHSEKNKLVQLTKTNIKHGSIGTATTHSRTLTIVIRTTTYAPLYWAKLLFPNVDPAIHVHS
jgi:hypothetical protein